jgi:hypothetical protein
MPNTVYAVFAEDWGWDSKPVLQKLFYEKTNADSYAEELRNEVYYRKTSGTDKVWCQVTVEDFEIQ